MRCNVIKWGCGLLAVAALVTFVYPKILREIASILIVEDVIDRGTAIVVLGGHLPFRAMEAANLYQAGWAPRVVLVQGARGEEQKALRALGVATPQEWELSREVLVRLGVPASAILVPDGEADSTLEELRIVAHALRARGAPVIFVTSKVHTRRVRLTWRYVTRGDSRAIVQPARLDPFDPDLWWRDRRFALEVVREYLGLLNYSLGFPLGARPTGQVAKGLNRLEHLETRG